VLYFSKTKIIIIYSTIIFLSFFALNNIFFSNNSFKLLKKINLGLDLQGGSYLLLEVDTDPIIEKKLQNKILSLRKILKEKNINYKSLSLKNNKITIKIPEEKITILEKLLLDKENSINTFYTKFNDYELDYSINENIFNLSFSKYGLIEINDSALNQSIEIVRRRVDETGTKEPTILKRGVNRILIELPGLKEPSRIKKLLGKTANLTFKFASENDSVEFGVEKLFFEKNDQSLIVNKRVVISGENLIDAKPSVDNQSNETIVLFSLDRPGAIRFGKATQQNVNKKLAIILDNKVISAPVVREPILGGNGQISGNFTFQEATDLALLLRSGALPAPLNIIEERTVGPDLGEDSIKAGTFSLIIGFVLVIFFMFFKYRFFGLISDISLVVNLFLLVGVLTLLEATLTLPGIAGIILTVGMAVDANVLIFERIKEEMKTEKSYLHAFDRGYKKAQSAVLDANITTLISAIILFFLGSGPVKGFAVTLGIGILTTLFSAYFFARHLTSLYIMNNKDKVIKI
tara:strand:- start:4569 stop:6125 length:1557 start_codon:yes stop_codon:yes gene_type:complete